MEEAVDLQGRPYSHLAFIWTLLAGTFTMSISQSSLSTAYPTLMQYFNIPASTVQWLTTGFMLVMVVMMPVSPWLLNNIQFPILFVSVLALFDVGTFIIYLATSFSLDDGRAGDGSHGRGNHVSVLSNGHVAHHSRNPAGECYGHGRPSHGVRISRGADYLRHCVEVHQLARVIRGLYVSCYGGLSSGPQDD